MPILEVNNVSTYTDAAVAALTVCRTELQVLVFDRSLIRFLDRQRFFDFFFDKRRQKHSAKKRRFSSFVDTTIVPLR